jgi:hypothetical protein
MVEMIHRPNNVEADVVRLIVTTREKFPHSVAWNDALKKVMWRYTMAGKPKRKRRRVSQRNSSR